MDELDDEALRDRLDVALGKAEDADKAVHTLDAMLNEPQVLIPVDDFGETLYAIIKEDTVVTVLPKGHGEEILHRGQALQAKVANGEAPRPEREPAERWDRRRAWRREPAGPVVIERPRPVVVQAKPTPVVKKVKAPAGAVPVRADNTWLRHEPTPDRPGEAVAGALWDALERGSRRAAVQALHELLERKDPEDDLLPIWNEIAGLGIPQGLKLSDLIDACALSKS